MNAGFATAVRGLRLKAPKGLPAVAAGDDLVALSVEALAREGESLCDGDVLVFAQKIVSKAEGRRVDLATVSPGPRARTLAAETGKDARIVELILGESTEVLRHRPGLIIVVHRLGLVLANAGIDQSNVGDAGTAEHVLLLPEDPDASCRRMRDEIARRCGVRVGVVISDSLGRAWRQGTVGTAIGAAGIRPLWDRRGDVDMFGRRLESTMIATADQIAAAAALLQGEADEGRPVAVLRGLDVAGDGCAADLLRPREGDLFR